MGVEKVVIDNEKDIESILDTLKTAKKAKGKQSISDFPDKTSFTTILFSFKSGGKSVRSMYDEDDELYIDQPYDNVYKLANNEKELLYKIINSGLKEDITLNLKQILNNGF